MSDQITDTLYKGVSLINATPHAAAGAAGVGGPNATDNLDEWKAVAVEEQVADEVTDVIMLGPADDEDNKGRWLHPMVLPPTTA